MRTIIAPFAGLAVLGLCAGTASAASPTYCALYAKKFTEHAAVSSQASIPPQRIHDRAYHKCLNKDDEPVLPLAYTDPAADGVGGPLLIDEGSTSAGAEETVLDEPAGDKRPVQEAVSRAPDSEPAKKPAGAPRGGGRVAGVLRVLALGFQTSAVETTSLAPDSKPVKKRVEARRDSGYAMWSPKWKAWCAKYFPNSFDPKSGTIIPFKTGQRTECR